MTKGQLEALWATVNPGNGDPHLMAAIALAESSGNPSATNSIGACGLWQIHPYEAGCLNPVANARQAGAKLRSQGLGAWETYTNGTYRQFYTGPPTSNVVLGVPPTSNVVLGVPGTPNIIPGESIPGELLQGKIPKIPNPLSALGSLGKIPGDFDKIYHLFFTPEGWIKVGKVLVGLFLLLEGVLGMANVSAAPSVIEVGKSAAPIVTAAVA